LITVKMNAPVQLLGALGQIGERELGVVATDVLVILGQLNMKSFQEG